MLQAHVVLLGQPHLAFLGRMVHERLEAGVTLGDDPEQIVDLALEPVGRGNPGRDGRIRVSVHTRAHHDHWLTRADDRAQLAVAVAGTAGDEQHHQPSAQPLELGRERAGVDGPLLPGDHTRPPITVAAAWRSRLSGLGIQTPSTRTTARLASIATAISGCSGRLSRARSTAFASPGDITIR